MKRKILLITIFVIFVIFIIIICYFNFGKQTSKYKIIKKFEKNELLFEKSIAELENIDEIYFTYKENIVNLYTYEDIGDNKVKKVNIEEKDYYKYEQTINLMKILEIEKVYKIRDNIIFLFQSSMLDPDNYSISYINNFESYVNTGHKIREKKQITDNWYYVVTMW